MRGFEGQVALGGGYNNHLIPLAPQNLQLKMILQINIFLTRKRPGRAGPGQGPGRAMGGDWIGWSRVSCQLVERSLAWLE